MKKIHYILCALLFVSSCVAAEKNKHILCEKSDCYSAYDKFSPDKKPIENSIQYSTGYGLLVDVYNGVEKIRQVDNGLVFQYQGEDKWVMFLAIPWDYNQVRVVGDYDAGSVFRGKDGLEIVIVGYQEDAKTSYEAYITHKNIPDDKVYAISSLGLSELEFKSIIGSLQFLSR